MRWSVRSLALALVVLVLAACSAVPGTSSSPSSSPASSTPAPIDSPPAGPLTKPSPSEPVAPTAKGSQAIEPTHVAGVEPGLYAEVVVNDLRVRSKPGVSDDSEKLEPLLRDGVRLLVMEGPIEASGYDWFHVIPSGHDKAGDNYPPGGVATGKAGEHWIEPFEFDCPPLPKDVEGLSDLNPVSAHLDLYYRISCYGGIEITFTARLEQLALPCVQSELPYVIEPSWFGEVCIGYLHGLASLKSYAREGVTWAPGVDRSMAAEPGAPPEAWPTVEVTGQFDHPEASTCQRVPNLEDTPDYRLPALTILDCRTQFVITSLREVEG